MNKLVVLVIALVSVASCTCNKEKSKVETPVAQQDTSDSVYVSLPSNIDPSKVQVNQDKKVFDELVAKAGTPVKDSTGVTYEVSIDEEGHYGYFISIDGVRKVRQFSIPAAGGYFASKADAQKVAELMTLKIKMGVQPPSVSIEELDALKIKY